MSTNTTTTPIPIPLRILMLHGYTQNPSLFHAKTRALHKSLLRVFPSPKYALSLHYVQASHKLPPASIPGFDPSEDAEDPEAYGWWMRKDRPDGTIVYEGIEKGLECITRVIRDEGPFAGVIGFSQGAAAAAMVASLLEGRYRKEAFERAEKYGGMPYPTSFLSEDQGFIQPPLQFAICYSGFRAPGTTYKAFYEPAIKTPVLNVLGQVDVVVDERRGRELVKACEGGEGRVVVHPGGHFVPSQKPWLDAVGGFVRECLDVEGGVRGRVEEGRVEDMDVPF